MSDLNDAKEKLKKRKAMLEKRVKREVNIMPRGGVFPKNIERKYSKDLLRLMAGLAKNVRETFFESGMLSRVLSRAKQELNVRQDTFDEDIEDLLRTLNLKVIGDLPDSAIERIAERHGLDVSQKSATIIKSQYKSVTGVDIFFNEPWLRPKLKTFTSSNVRLIKGIRDEALKNLEGVIFRGVSRGQSLADIQKDVQKTLGVTKRRAKLIARDQTASLNGELTKLRQQEVGVTRYRWQTARDERVRDEHVDNSGQFFEWSDPPSTGHPGEDINCRCIAIPVFSSIK